MEGFVRVAGTADVPPGQGMVADWTARAWRSSMSKAYFMSSTTPVCTAGGPLGEGEPRVPSSLVHARLAIHVTTGMCVKQSIR